MKSTYEIQGWDPILNGENTMAMIYVKPDINLLQIFNNSIDKNVLLSISDSGTLAYDNKVVWGVIDKSSDIIANRQNLFNNSGLYVITLNITWFGYPLNNGNVTFLDKPINTIEKL